MIGEHEHVFVEEYYGWHCAIPGCDLFYAYGCAPWEIPDDEDGWEESHSLDCICETCIQNHPERDSGIYDRT